MRWERFRRQAPWWLPDAIDDRIFDRMYDGVRGLLNEVRHNPDHQLRREIRDRLETLAVRLATSSEYRSQGHRLAQELASRPEMSRLVTSLWEEATTTLRTPAAHPRSRLHELLAATIVAVGQRLDDDPVLQCTFEDALESSARVLAESFGHDIVVPVGETIARWDGEEASSRLELLLGPDLQYIRINGTVIGGLAGTVIHALAAVIG
jgi:uncharacterized membrane-anchored protein YjiN (DUF445 family)